MPLPFVKLTNSVPYGKVLQSAVCIGQALALGCSQACEMLDIASTSDALFGLVLIGCYTHCCIPRGYFAYALMAAPASHGK